MLYAWLRAVDGALLSVTQLLRTVIIGLVEEFDFKPVC